MNWMTQACRDEVRSFLIGCLLGDTYANGDSYQWHWGNVDKGYVEWKAAYVRKNLRMKCKVWEQNDPTCRDGKMYCFAAASRKGRLKVYRNWFYLPNGKKTITSKIRFFDHPIGLAVLILDQGSCRGGLDINHKNGQYYYRKPSVRLHLNAHNEDELLLFQETLVRNFGLKTSTHRKSGGYSDLYFGTRETQKLWGLISEWVPQIGFAKKKFHPIISQTTNAHHVKRPRGVRIESGSGSCSGKASFLHC